MLYRQVLLRLVCLALGTAVQMIFMVCIHRFRTGRREKRSAWLLQGMTGICTMTMCCATAVLTVPLSVPVTILYTGLGMAVVCMARKPTGMAEQLPMLCTWLILYLPVTGALACLGGGLLVLTADVPEIAVPAILVLASPMAFLQFGPEGALVLLGTVALLSFGRGLQSWKSLHGADTSSTGNA